MKTEHEKLKEISDEIGYDLPNDKFLIWENKKTIYKMFGLDKYKVDVREIIFIPEFMDKYMKYVEDKGIVAPSKYKVFLIDLHNCLDNPVDYLYNLLKLGNH